MRRVLFTLPLIALLAVYSVPNSPVAHACSDCGGSLTSVPAPGSETVMGSIGSLNLPGPVPVSGLTPNTPAPPTLSGTSCSDTPGAPAAGCPTCSTSITSGSQISAIPPANFQEVQYSIPLEIMYTGSAASGSGAFAPTNGYGAMQFPTNVTLGAGLIDTGEGNGFEPISDIKLTAAQLQEAGTLGLFVTASGGSYYWYNASTGTCSWNTTLTNVTRAPNPGGVPFTYVPPTPTPTAAPLLASLVSGWKWGSEQLLPADGVTYVGMPTCGAIVNATGIPTQTEYLVATSQTQTEAVASGATGSVEEWVVYIVTIAPSSIAWNYGDGISTGSGAEADKPTETEVNSPPSGDPSYDPDDQQWTNTACANPGSSYHYYTAISGSRTISAVQTDTASAVAKWDTGSGAGVTTVTEPVPCTGSAGTTVGNDCLIASQWAPKTVQVRQIEGVPVLP